MSQANVVTRDTAAAQEIGKAAVRRANRARLLRPILMIGGIVAVLVGAGLFWLLGGRYVTSDDTYVDAAKVSLSTDVSGTVDEVAVHDNQHVSAGQVLFKIGQESHQIAVNNAQARLDQAAEQVDGAKRAYAQALANIKLQDVQVAKDKVDLGRYAQVIKSGGVTQSVYDDAKFTLQADQSKLAELQDEAGVQLSKLSDNPEIKVQDTPEYRQALAELNDAKLNQADSVVKAPYSGTVMSVEQLQPRHVSAGRHRRLRAGLGYRCVDHRAAEGKRSDLGASRPEGGHHRRYLSRAEMAWCGAEHQPGQRVGILHPAGAELLRQLGQSGAAHPGPGKDHFRAQRVSAARRHERGNFHRHQPPPAPVRHLLVEDIPRLDADRIGGVAANTRHRFIITICLMIATLMQALDTTVANVSLPYMQGSLSASYNQITWVLTSYVVASAIFTAPVGWLTARFGAKNLMLTCMIGFTITSVMCGLSPNLTDVVMARFLQGMFGAAVVPLSQSTLIDIYPPEKRGVTMSLWGLGVMLGPVLGPTLGGFLTSHYDWRYVFFVNVPFGIAGTLGLLFYMPRVEPGKGMRFDWIGFFILSLGLATLQIALDRGDQLDWLSSPIIVMTLTGAALCIYLFIVHIWTARDPFIPRSIFADMNFNGALLTMFTVGATLLASLSLLPPYLENLANYPVEYTGIVMAPRGIGTVCAMLLAGRLTNRIDPRLLMLLGYAMLTSSLYMQQSWTPDISVYYIGTTIALQGAAIGFVFVPLQVIAYQTLAPGMYTQAAALLALLRSIGSAIGVSVTTYMLDRQTQYEHAELSQYITPFARPLQTGGAVSRMMDPHSLSGASMLNAIIGTQSQIIAYVDDYKLMLITTLPALLCLFFMRRPPPIVTQPGR